VAEVKWFKGESLNKTDSMRNQSTISFAQEGGDDPGKPGWVVSLQTFTVSTSWAFSLTYA